MKDQIQRLGFEAWADNIIVNAIENMGDGTAPLFNLEEGDVTLIIRMNVGTATATVRAYVEGKGWDYHDRTFTLKGGRP